MTRQSVYLDAEKRDLIAPLLKRRGQTLSSWIRTKMDDFLEEHERIAAGKTQIDPVAFNHGGDAA